MKRAVYPLLAGALLLLSSCATRPVPRPAAPHESRTAGDLMQVLCRYNQDVYAVDGEGVGVYKDRSKTLGFRAQLDAYWPSMDLRLSVQDIVFKKPLITLVKQGNQVRAALHTKRELFEMKYRDTDFERLTGFDIPGRLLLSTLTGKVYLDGMETVTLYEPRLLGLSSDTGVITVSFDKELRPSEIQYVLGESTYDVTFSGWVDRSGVFFPMKIRINEQREGLLLEITYNSVHLNREEHEELTLREDEYPGYRIVH